MSASRASRKALRPGAGCRTSETIALPIAGEHIVKACKRATGNFNATLD